MSVVINTNQAATVAADNLANSNALLQRSLNRLSSGSKIVNPADDAGGLAVSMKLSAAAKRQGAVSNNISNAVSLLQTQDGVLSVSGKILSRISELKVLNSDITKSASDRANYQSEFAALQTQLTANGGETFNGVSLFGTNALNVATTEDGTTSVGVQGVDLLGTGGAPAWSNVSGVVPGVGWNSSNPQIANFLGYTRFHGDGNLTTSQSNITGPYTLNFTSMVFGSGGTATVTGGGGASLDLAALSAYDGVDHSVSIAVDAAGTASWSFNGGAQTGTLANFGSASGGAIAFSISGTPSIDMHIKDGLTLTSTGGGGPSNNVGTVAAAASLSALGLSSITGAISDVSTYRANNGAGQSRLGFATELLSVNKANLEAANSRITDVDVAQESTTLARYNVLVQAGTSMLAQANQSSQMALKLLG
jgi:flagellin